MNDRLRSEIVGLEERYWRALQDGDVDEALELTSDPCVVAGAQGVARVDKAAFAGMMRTAEWKLRAFELSDVVVEQPADNVAIVGYRVREECTVNGAPLTIEAADTSTWVRGDDGEWTCAVHTESLAGDPYGRDRKGFGAGPAAA